MNTNETIATEILKSIIDQLKTTMIDDKSPLTEKGLWEIHQRLKLASDLLSES